MKVKQNSEEKYDNISLKAALGAIPGLVFLKDGKTGEILFCNDSYVRLAGKTSKEEVLGKTAFDLFDPVNAAKFAEDDRLALSMDQPKIILYEGFRGADGKPIRLKTTKSKYVDPSGRTYLLGISDDITEITEGLLKTKKETEEIRQLNEDLDTFCRLNHSNRYTVTYRWDAVDAMDIASVEYSDDLRKAFGFASEDDFPDEIESWTRLIHLEDKEAVRAVYEESFVKGPTDGSGRDNIEVEYRALMKDGGYRWFRNVSELEVDKKNGGLRMLGIVLDINDTREMELRQEIVEAIGESTAGLYYVDTINDRFRIFKRPDYIPEEIVTTVLPYTKVVNQWIDVGVAKEDQPKMYEAMKLENIRDKLKDTNIYSVTYQSNGKKDHGYFEMRASRPLDVQEITNVTIGFYDCSDSVLAELERQRMAEQLENQNSQLARFKTLAEFFLNTFVSAYYVNLRDGSCITLKRTEQLEEEYPIESGYLASVREYISRDVHPDDREVMYMAVDPRYIRKQLKDKNEFSLMMRDITGGREKTYRYLVIRGEDEDHTAFGFIDITEDFRKEKEQKAALENALEEAKKANQAKTDFLFNMSHDVRTPMNAITGYTAMAKKYLSDAERTTDYLNKIEISGNQLLSLINQVLEMSRIESGKVVLAEDKANVVEKAEEMCTISAADASAKNLNFRKEIGDVVHENVLCDASRMNQVILNVIGNAIKYTPEGGNVTYRIEEKEGDQEGWSNYVFTIIDDGIGMSQEFCSRIFEEFSRENNSTVSHIQGTGLGMSIVKKLVDLMNGTIDIESEKGKGTTVRITIPMKIDTQADSEKKEETEKREVSLNGMKILLAEDNEMNREIAKVILEDSGAIIEDVVNGQEAVDRLKEKGAGYYDLVLMDIQMPVMNGYEATKQIRELPDRKLAEIPIVAMTANAFEEDRKAAFDAGMNEHIAKPINIQAMKETLAKFMQ